MATSISHTARRLYNVQASFTKVAPHHASIKALWETKWRKPCSLGIYPFTDGKLEDFEKVFTKLGEMDLKEPYNPDEYAAPFFPVAADLESQAKSAMSKGDTILAAQLDLRAAAIYRIARFPIPRSPKTNEAWTLGKAAYLRASPHMSPPNSEVSIPHTHGVTSEGKEIQAYLRLPPNASAEKPVPVLLFICGLDAYRSDHTSRIEEHVRRGFACISVEIPGTGDSPALRDDPESPDRQWSSVLDWIATRPELDSKKVCVRGVSTGGYYAMRIAHTHAERLWAVVSQGGGSHGMFDPEWIAAQDKMEYPFALAEALMHKFGYKDVETYAKDAQKRFSLLETGIIDKPSCRLLLINGTNDEIFPIEDSSLLLEHGNIKEARFVKGRYHMGDPEAEGLIYGWLDSIL